MDDYNSKRKDPYFISYLFMPLVVIAVVLLIYGISRYLNKKGEELNDILTEDKAIEDIREGIVVDKLIINSQTKANVGVGVGLNGNGKVGVGLGVGGSEYVPMEYRIVIEGEYEFKGEKKKAKKEIQVSENTYNSYKIGEHFDSRNLKINDSSGGYSVIKTDSSGELTVEQHIKEMGGK